MVACVIGLPLSLVDLWRYLSGPRSTLIIDVPASAAGGSISAVIPVEPKLPDAVSEDKSLQSVAALSLLLSASLPSFASCAAQPHKSAAAKAAIKILPLIFTPLNKFYLHSKLLALFSSPPT